MSTRAEIGDHGNLRAVLSVPEIINFGGVHTSETVYGTTEEWNSDPTLVSKPKTLYVYTDYADDGNGGHIAAFKMGDGNAHLVDLPFYSPVSTEDKNFWSNKVSMYVDPLDPEHLIFTTN